VKALAVWLQDRRVGRLWESGGGRLCFEYDPDCLEGDGVPLLSRSLPSGPEPLRGPAVRAFFSGLLPEGSVRRQVAANLGLSEANDFALLAALGGDCAGALRLCDEEDGPALEPAPVAISENELERRLMELPRRPLLAGEEEVRFSLAGAQSKLPMRRVRGVWSFSTFSSPSTHILKPESREFPGLAAVEAFSLDLAERVGLPVVKGEWQCFGTLPCLIVERYDREIDVESGEVFRLHQEDLCQALGLPPHRKYQQEGGPAAGDALACIRAWSTAPVLDVGFFLDLWVFNVVLGNADAHGKNWSWLYRGGQRRLAPAYDLVSTALWPELSPRMAMRVGQAKFLAEVRREHFLKFAKDNRISAPAFRKRIGELCEKICQELSAGLEAAPGLTPAFRETLNEEIRARAANIGGGAYEDQKVQI